MTPACRHCATPLTHTFCDLGVSPLANSYLGADDLLRMEPFYPLKVYVCSECLLVQLPEWESPEAIFGDYAYFSSYSKSWLRHAERYVDAMIGRFGLGADSQVVEVASNDGYLLQYFVARGVPVLGIEPAANVAKTAVAKGIPTRVEFFGAETADRLVAQGVRADLLLGNNVLAHTPRLDDFVEGVRRALAATGVATFEFPHLQRLMAESQFDTIYHEHFSYFSFGVVRRIFASHGLELFDVEELPTHGGSLRIYARHWAHAERVVTPRVRSLLAAEAAAGLDRLEGHLGFGERVRATKRGLLRFLLGVAERGETLVGYGAPAKGNTLLNYCGVGPELVAYTVDRNPEKQGTWLPGSRIPVYAPEKISETRPDWVLILPWNLKDEIAAQMAEVSEWGGRFVVAVPEVEEVRGDGA